MARSVSGVKWFTWSGQRKPHHCAPRILRLSEAKFGTLTTIAPPGRRRSRQRRRSGSGFTSCSRNDDMTTRLNVSLGEAAEALERVIVHAASAEGLEALVRDARELAGDLDAVRHAAARQIGRQAGDEVRQQPAPPAAEVEEPDLALRAIAQARSRERPDPVPAQDPLPHRA